MASRTMLPFNRKWLPADFSTAQIFPTSDERTFLPQILTVDGKCSIPAYIRFARFNSQIPAFLRPCFAAYRGNLRSPRRSTAREVARKYWQPGVERLEGDCVSRVDPVVESGQARSINDFAPVEWSSDDSGFHRQEEPKPDSSGGVFLSPDPLRI